MGEYKCISCGATKNSEKTCSCAECGYKMYETPYERRELLRSEIRNFIARHKYVRVKPDDFEVFRNVPTGKDKETEEDRYKYVPKKEDDKRFPPFKDIQKYVCAATKTEIFHERLNSSLDQIRKHITTPYAQSYCVSFNCIKKDLEPLDSVLKEILKELGIQKPLPEASLPDIVMDYSETPDTALTDMAENILGALGALADEIKLFIRKNNIYGTSYREVRKTTYKYSEERDFKEDLRQCADRLSVVLSKKYTVDIFSDGSEELAEMMEMVWYAVAMILALPMLKKKYVYTMDDGTRCVGGQIADVLQHRIEERYRNVDEAIYRCDFLSDKTEEELFAIYDRMIELDSNGFMGINKDKLVKAGESERKLNELIGLAGIKESIQKIKAYALSNRGSEALNIHMCFLGNPGTGKTEVARYIAGILYENKILPTNKVVEVDRSGLVSEYFGATAEKTKRVIASAMGGVLFVDEAYALGNTADAGVSDYGKEAIDTLVKAMEDSRGKFCVIFAGYKNEMLQMLALNPGFKSRIQFMLDFPNYSRDELQRIAQRMIGARKYAVSETAMSRILDVADVKRKEPNFANARELRNILDQVIMCQNIRCQDINDREIGIADVNKYLQDAKIHLPTRGEGVAQGILTGEEELDRLVGLAAVKRMVRKIKAYAKRNKDEAGFNLHMCFYGNPGTGKTEVARILSRILYDAGVLAEAKLVETDGHGLLGRFVGETAPKTTAKINDAMNGVLFIDEAYCLNGSTSAGGGVTNYGEDAIAVLLKEMEDRRGQFCVILAGYKEEMQDMISTNPGFESRIQFTLEFPDYSRDELGEIAQNFLSQKKYSIQPDAMERLLDITEYYRKRPNFANARTVRNILEQVLLNQNLRTEDSENSTIIILSDVEDYLMDEGIDLNEPPNTSRRIGFV